MQQINLIDARLLPAPHLLSGARLVTLAALACAVVGAQLGIESRRMTQALSAAAAAAPPADAGAGEVDDGEAGMLARIAERQALHDVLAKTDQRPLDSAGLLRDVIAALPERVWLTAVDVQGAHGVRIAGAALDMAGLREFAERLGRVGALRGVPLETLRIEPQQADSDVDGSAGHDPGAGADDVPARAPVQRFVLASAATAEPQADR